MVDPGQMGLSWVFALSQVLSFHKVFYLNIVLPVWKLENLREGEPSLQHWAKFPKSIIPQRSWLKDRMSNALNTISHLTLQINQRYTKMFLRKSLLRNTWTQIGLTFHLPVWQLTSGFRMNLGMFLGVVQWETRLKPDGMFGETWKQWYSEVPRTTWQNWRGSADREQDPEIQGCQICSKKVQKDLRNLNKGTD